METKVCWISPFNMDYLTLPPSCIARNILRTDICTLSSTLLFSIIDIINHETYVIKSANMYHQQKKSLPINIWWFNKKCASLLQSYEETLVLNCLHISCISLYYLFDYFLFIKQLHRLLSPWHSYCPRNLNCILQAISYKCTNEANHAAY